MSYATLTQMTERFGAGMLTALTDRAEMATGLVDEAVVSRALTEADAMIDGYLAGRYTLPLSEVPRLLADLAQVIAIWKLHLSEPDPKIIKDYDQALRSLRDIATGALRIPGAAGLEPAVTSGSGARITDRERPLTAENLKGFI
jgi:phage gp36-like protein